MPRPVTDLPLLEIQTNRGIQASTRQVNVQLNNVPSASTTSYVSSLSNNINSNMIILPRTSVLSKMPMWAKAAVAVTTVLVVASAVAVPTALSVLPG